jgi:hypothetical protein
MNRIWRFIASARLGEGYLDPGNAEYTATLTDLIKEEMLVHNISWKELERNNGYYFNLTPTQSPHDLRP